MTGNSIAPSQPQLFDAQVMHKRLIRKVNAFLYKVYYLMLPLSVLDNLPLRRNKFGALSFYDKDHGACDGSSLEGWARGILKAHNIKQADGEIVLVCMPRIFGYVFNPVSFWLCHDRAGAVRAVIAEVNNTFGERHSYLCVKDDGGPIEQDDKITAQKLFHVSPFLQREGHYEFRFAFKPEKLGIWIDYFNDNGDKQLLTSLIGECREMSKTSLRRAFWEMPLVTFKTIVLIHWQAVKLLAKGIKYVPKPKQLAKRLSLSD